MDKNTVLQMPDNSRARLSLFRHAKQNNNRRSVIKRLLCLLLTVLSVLPLIPCVHAVDDPENLTSQACLIYNLETDSILWGREIDTSVFPTSTVKIILGMLALEYYADNLDTVLTVPMEAISGAGGNVIGLVAGEEISVRHLLYAVLMSGANDAACVLAYTIAGNVTAFVNQMNAKAQQLGCRDTVYTNCTGVHDDNMRTTARDTLRIALYAYTNSNFMAMSSETRHIIPETNKRPERTIVNRNFIVSTQYYTKYYNSLAKGMNAGNTKEGGYCLVTSIRKQGCTYIVVCMNSYYNEEENFIYTYSDCETLVDWAYNNYDFVSVVDNTTMICEIPVELSLDVDYVTLLPEKPIEMFLPKDIDIDTAITLNHILLSDTIEAPVAEGEIAGMLTVKYDGELVAAVNLVTKGSITRSEFLNFLTIVRRVVTSRTFAICVGISLLIALLYVLFTAVYREKARKRALRRKYPHLTRK
ncbi:MAG: D-alanyl-D-alanine carboxypeptidase [Clostridia bacterium]|nr:D-alanyl-D-alanine carboxypeptidase [Clostridia bacterium]